MLYIFCLEVVFDAKRPEDRGTRKKEGNKERDLGDARKKTDTEDYNTTHSPAPSRPHSRGKTTSKSRRLELRDSRMAMPRKTKKQPRANGDGNGDDDLLSIQLEDRKDRGISSHFLPSFPFSLLHSTSPLS